MKIFYNLLFLIELFNCFSNSQVFYEPRFHNPNTLTYDGASCSETRPTQNLKCPVFGIYVISNNEQPPYTFLRQKEIEDKCTELGFQECESGTNLFPDGVCRRCTDGFTLDGDGTGDLWCTNGSEEIRYENPFNCNNFMDIPRTIQNSYRPCIYKAGLEKVPIPHYHQRGDLDGQQTMYECWLQILRNMEYSNNYKSNDSPKVMTEFDDIQFGFNLCPKANEEYSFTTPTWVFFYVFYIVGIFSNIIYIYFKKYKERIYFANSTKIPQREDTVFDLLEIEIMNSHHVDQYGLNMNIFGHFCWLMYWIMSWGFIILNLMLILDIYGMFKNWLCPQHINERCSTDIFSIREGFPCTSGCIFSHRETKGIDNYWPYEPNPGSIDQMFAIYLTMFFLSFIWWTLTIVFYTNIRNSFYVKCDMKEATYVMCYKKKEKEIRLDQDKNDRVVKIITKFESLIHKYISTVNHDAEICKIYNDNTGNKYLYFQFIKYLYHKERNLFLVKSPIIGKTKSDIYNLGTSGLSSQGASTLLQVCGENKIKYDLPSLRFMIWEEFFNLYSYIQLTFLMVLYYNYYWRVAIPISIIIFSAATIRILVRKSSRRKIKKISENFSYVDVKRNSNFMQISSHQLVPGDVIKINPGDTISADCILITGRAVMNESSLTGEPSPVPKLSLPDLDEPYGLTNEDMKYTLLSGTQVESVSPGINGCTLGIVFTTGIHTKKGQLLWAMLFPPNIRFKFDDHLVAVFVVLITVGLLCYIVIGYVMYWIPWSVFFWLSFLSNYMNPLLPAMFAGAQAKGASDLKRDCNIFTLELNRIFLAAKIKTFCFDKTGTLTKQGMNFNGFSSYNAVKKLNFSTNISSLSNNLRLFMGCCQELEFLQDKSVGNEVDTAMFEASNYEFIENINSATIMMDKSTKKKWSIIKRFEFNRENMMMSSVVEDLDNHEQFLLSKGSFEQILSRCSNIDNKQELSNYVTRYSTTGHYILGIAIKKIQENNTNKLLVRQELENDLDFVGLLHFKNDLKYDTKNIIENIKNGDIKCLMVTGDNIYTACNIAIECGICNTNRIIIGNVVDPSSNEIKWIDFHSLKTVNLLENMEDIKNRKIELALTYDSFKLLKDAPASYYTKQNDSSIMYRSAMHYLLKYVKVFARMKPDNKVEVVRMNMDFGITGMCGDGANDTAALRMSHCGIAISSGSGHPTIVAPFNSSRESLEVVIDVIRHGRGALATGLAGYKRMVSYSLSVITLRFYAFHSLVQLSDVCWIFLDAFLNVALTIGILWSKPAKKLSPSRPTSALFGREIAGSLISHSFLFTFFFICAFIMLFQQEFIYCKMFDASTVNLAHWWTMGDNYESMIIAVMMCAANLNCSFIYNYGFDYRKSWYKNWLLMIIWVFSMIILAICVLTDASLLPCLFHFNCGDHYLLEAWDKIDLLEYNGDVPLVPKGCPCDQQVAITDLCDQPYQNCTATQYNSEFHHNIMPIDFRFKLWFYSLGMLCTAILVEWFVIYGPVRRYFKSKREAKNI